MKRVQMMTPEGLEEHLLLDGVLVWPMEPIECRWPSSTKKEESLSQVFSATLSIVRAPAAKQKESE